MKIKTKLIISFCIILFVPIVLAMVTVSSFFWFQVRSIRKNYGIQDIGAENLTNTVQMLNRYTVKDFEDLKEKSRKEPDYFQNPQYLQMVNGHLVDKYSYLIVRKNEEILFNGGLENNGVLLALPDFDEEDSASGADASYIDSTEEILVKQLDFHYTDGGEGSVFIVTSTKAVQSELRHLLVEAMVAVFLILLLTAGLLIWWVYRSIVTPIKKLQTAAENITEGNLDFTVDVYGEDEIGELGVSFEGMRQRLKDNAEEKHFNERENRALISNIAHDLKTPITALKGYAEGIMDGVANTPEKVGKYVRTIYNKANEMDALINELTLYSKIDTNRIPYNFAKINLAEYFEDCVEEIGLELESKGIGLAYHNYVDSEVLIVADPEQLRRAISNIVSNSVKYMDKERGFINIRIKDVEDFVQVEMEDNGRGIAQKDLPYIFERFYRTDASRNSSTGGSGIGLSIVKKIVEDHGGRIWATSKEGTGTILYFVIRKYEEVCNE